MRHAIFCAAALLATPLRADPILPVFAAGAFVNPVENPYFPLGPGQRSVLSGTATADGGPVPAMLVRSVVGRGPVMLGVATTMVVDAEYEDGRLMELTMDYYAPDHDGNIWYFGEDVTNFLYDDTGILTATETGSSWHAGLGDGQPGIVMLSQPTAGISQFAGFAPAAGETDYGEVTDAAMGMAVAAGTFSDVVKIYTQSRSDPDLREYRYWARDVGLIRVEEDLSVALDAPGIILELQP